MKNILFNLALYLTTIYCRDNKIDCSGSHLYKYPRRWTYALVNDKDGRAIITLNLHKSQAPTYFVHNK